MVLYVPGMSNTPAVISIQQSQCINKTRHFIYRNGCGRVAEKRRGEVADIGGFNLMAYKNEYTQSKTLRFINPYII